MHFYDHFFLDTVQYLTLITGRLRIYSSSHTCNISVEATVAPLPLFLLLRHQYCLLSGDDKHFRLDVCWRQRWSLRDECMLWQ